MKGQEAFFLRDSGREEGNLRKSVVDICRPQHPTRDPGLGGHGRAGTSPRAICHTLISFPPPMRAWQGGREDQLTLAAPVWCNRTWLLAEPLCNKEGEGEVSVCGPRKAET